MIRKSLLACALAAATLPAFAAELTFEVTGIEGAEGQVMVVLYDEAGFLKKPLMGVRLAPAGKTVSGTFGEVPTGFYAVIAFHDENANGKLDRNLLGIPTEKLGFSNNAKGMMGPASFADAKFEVTDTSKAVVVTLD